jgi:hypothetical protein
MEPLIFYWVLTLVVLLVLTMLTDVGTASIITTFIVLMKFMTQKNDNSAKTVSNIEGFESENTTQPTQKNVDTIKTGGALTRKKVLPKLKPEVMLENSKILDDILYPTTYNADDRIFNASVISGYKNKKAIEIRSHLNNNNWKKYFDKEFGEHENRIWWENDDFELSKKHVVI